MNTPVATRLVIMCSQTGNTLQETSTPLIPFVLSYTTMSVLLDQSNTWLFFLTNHKPGYFVHHLVILYSAASRRYIKTGIRIVSQYYFDSVRSHMIVIIMSGDVEKLLKKESDILNEAIDVGINAVEPKIKGFLTG